MFISLWNATLPRGGKIRAGQSMDFIFFAIMLIMPSNNNTADGPGSDLAPSREGCSSCGSTVGRSKGQRDAPRLVTNPGGILALEHGETDAEL